MRRRKTYQIRPYERGFAIYRMWFGLPLAVLMDDDQFCCDTDRLFATVRGFGSHEQAITYLQILIRQAGVERYRDMSHARAVKRHAAAFPPRTIPPWKV